jgi:hypothetical protein
MTEQTESPPADQPQTEASPPTTMVVEEAAPQTTEESSPPSPAADNNNNSQPKSALQANIEAKGKNAYYFAHSHKANGPKWDGKAEPRLLSSSTSSSIDSDKKPQLKKASFDIHKSNITSYAFSDEGKSVKLYITLPEVGEVCSDNDIVLEWNDHSFSLVVNNYKEQEPKCLSFGRLTAKITKAACRKKKDRLILILTKEDEGKEWHTVNDKGAPDHELV